MTAPVEIRGGTVLTLADRSAREGSVFVEDGRIAGVFAAPQQWDSRNAAIVDATGCAVLPGLVQAHVHVCQTLARGAADDLPLLDWLRRRVWPYEAALDEKSMRACARLAATELLRGGTTAILDMGTVHEEDALVDEVARSGLRAVVGKAMMDAGDGVPARLRETTQRSLDESDRLAQSCQRTGDGRLGYAYAPRFVLTCTEELLRAVAERQRAGARVHTHASEQREEIALVRARLGDDNARWLDGIGIGGERVVLAHCVHVTDDEIALLARRGTHVAHCPSSNLKLASGIAPVKRLLDAGVHVALGADGAPCNNNLDAFVELRLAALLHKSTSGAAALPAWQALELATKGGAAALGLSDTVGTLEAGKRADVIVVRLDGAHVVPWSDAASALVYAARSTDVKDVLVDGRLLVSDGRLTATSGLDDVAATVATARDEARRVAARAGL